MAVQITSEQERLVQTLLESGEYQTPTEVLDEALRLLEKRERLRADLRAGLDELDRGERLDGEDVFRELRARAAEIESGQ